MGYLNLGNRDCLNDSNVGSRGFFSACSGAVALTAVALVAITWGTMAVAFMARAVIGSTTVRSATLNSLLAVSCVLIAWAAVADVGNVSTFVRRLFITSRSGSGRGGLRSSSVSMSVTLRLVAGRVIDMLLTIARYSP